MLLSPGLIGLALLIAYPLVFEFYLAFHDLKLTTIREWTLTGNLPFVGFKHFIRGETEYVKKEKNYLFATQSLFCKKQ